MLVACAATGLVHLWWLSQALGIDEGGFAMVARHWHEPGGYLYGPQWVDRPPALLAVFDLADHLGAYGVRITAGLVAVGLVAAVSAAARAAAGRAAAAWSAWTGFAFTSSVLLDAQQLNGELVAGMFVAASIAGILTARRPETRRAAAVLAAGASGLCATTAVFVKQDFVDGLAFAVVLLVSSALRCRRPPACDRTRLALLGGGFGMGAVAGLAVVQVWASAHGGASELLYAMFEFRRDASLVIAEASWGQPLQRLGILALAAVGSGLAVLGAHLLAQHRSRLLARSPLATALTAAALVEVVGVLGGGNFWRHYLLGLVPTVALAAGLAAHRPAPGARRTRGVVACAVVITAVSSPVAALVSARSSDEPFVTGRWLARSSRPGDTLVVAYTHSNVIQASGLTPVYPYAWSLPLRTLDPHLDLLVTTLRGPRRATWVVVWDDLHNWGLDADHRVERALRRGYRRAAAVCGRQVWLRDDTTRSLPAAPPPAAC